MMKNLNIVVAATLLASPVYAAKSDSNLSPLQIQQMQIKNFEAPYDLVFSAVVSVLQDSGFRLETADKISGFISGLASTPTKKSWFTYKKQTPVASVFIEKISQKNTQVRINFVTVKEKSYGYGTARRDETPVLDQTAYSDAFEKISQAIFIRQSLIAKEKVE